jgi:hypothetical protein
MRNKILVLAMAAAGVAFSGASVAANQGTVGATSSGDVVINATIPKLIRITGLTDVTINPTNSATGFDAVVNAPGNGCVRQNGSGTYGIVATSVNGAAIDALTPLPVGDGAFVLKSGTLSLAYSLQWKGAPLPYATNVGSQAPDSTSLGSCAATGSNLGVNISAAALDDALAGTYTDTVTLVVTPE